MVLLESLCDAYLFHMLHVFDRHGLSIMQTGHLACVPLAPVTAYLDKVFKPVSIVNDIHNHVAIDWIHLLIEVMTQGCAVKTRCQQNGLVKLFRVIAVFQLGQAIQQLSRAVRVANVCDLWLSSDRCDLVEDGRKVKHSHLDETEVVLLFVLSRIVKDCFKVVAKGPSLVDL